MSAVVDPGYRPLGLETDLANPNFAGARNPDDLLWVQFSMKAVQNNYRTQRENRPIFEDQLWVEIRVPGNQLSIIETPATEEHKRRFPRQWAYFQQTHGAEGQNVGTPLSQWPLLRGSQVEELKALKFYTVEQLAFASDEQIGKIGMLAGMAPFSFRERAKLYLESAKNSAAHAQQAEELKKRNEELVAARKAQEERDAQHAKEMAEMRAALSALSEKVNAPRRGRPPKNPPPEGS